MSKIFFKIALFNDLCLIWFWKEAVTITLTCTTKYFQHLTPFLTKKICPHAHFYGTTNSVYFKIKKCIFLNLSDLNFWVVIGSWQVARNFAYHMHYQQYFVHLHHSLASTTDQSVQSIKQANKISKFNELKILF